MFFEISSRVVELINLNSWTFESVAKKILPMHFCSVMMWTAIFALITKKQFLINFSTIGGILATIVFLLYPSVGLNRTYMSFTCIYSTVSHMLGFVCCILFITLKKAKFELKDIWKTYACFAVMFLWGVLLNFVIFPGENYMYFARIPDGVNINLPFPYQIGYFTFMIIYVLLYYLISYLIKRTKLKHKA